MYAHKNNTSTKKGSEHVQKKMNKRAHLKANFTLLKFGKMVWA